MRSWLLTLAVVSLFVMLISSGVYVLLVSDKNVEPVVHEIETSAMIGGNNGSGTLIAPGVVMTASHVASDLTYPVPVTLGDGETTRAVSVISNDPKNDVALIKVESTRDPGDRGISCGPLRKGQRLTLMVSQELIADHVPVTARVLSPGIAKLEPDKDLTMVQASILPGMSGGAAYDEYGRIVGIVDMTVKMTVLTIQGPELMPMGYGMLVSPRGVCETLSNSGYDFTGGQIVRVR